MCQPPSDKAIGAMLGPALPLDVTIKKVQPVLSTRPQRTYEVLLSDGSTLHLVLPPLSMWRPLRSEQGMLFSEATAVRWIRETLIRRQNTTSTREQDGQPSTPPESNLTTSPSLLYLPNLLRHSQETHLPNSSFAVYGPTPGTPLELLSPAPSTAIQQHIDLQLGSLFRSLATLTSPTGRFGPLAAVIGGTNASISPLPLEITAVGAAEATAAKLSKVLVEGGLSAMGGAGTWSVAFHSMLEGVLRDGEDMAVVISYSTIRRHFRRLGYLLDEVTTGRLVVVEAAARGNVLVARNGKDEEQKGDGPREQINEEGKEGKGKGGGGDGAVEEERGEAKKDDETDTKGDDKSESEPPQREEETDTQPRRKNLNLTGLRDWSSAVFGDPLLATVFSDPHQQPPSSAFLEGFNGETLKSDPNPRRLPPNLAYPINKAVIEDVDTAWIRLLLYQVYHAVTRIVTEFYRPRQDSSARELEARKKLNEVLARLAEVPDDSKKRHKRPDGEMSPAKRVRGADDG